MVKHATRVTKSLIFTGQFKDQTQFLSRMNNNLFNDKNGRNLDLGSTTCWRHSVCRNTPPSRAVTTEEYLHRDPVVHTSISIYLQVALHHCCRGIWSSQPKTVSNLCHFRQQSISRRLTVNLVREHLQYIFTAEEVCAEWLAPINIKLFTLYLQTIYIMHYNIVNRIGTLLNITYKINVREPFTFATGDDSPLKAVSTIIESRLDL